MKLLAATLVLLLAGCAARTVEIPPVTFAPIDVVITGPSRPEELKTSALGDALAKKAFGADSVAGQITLGCASYLRATGRWPQSKEEIAEGLAGENLAANRLSELQKITFREEDGSLLIDFTASGNASGTLRLHPPKKTAPSQSRARSQGRSEHISNGLDS